MGNTAPGGVSSKRDRADSGGKRGFDEDYPVQVKVPKHLQHQTSSTPSMQFEDTHEFPVVVKWNGPAKAVAITGSWNNWKSRIPLVKSHDDFTTIVNLPEGRHEYKFHVDGQWLCDNTLPKTDNGLGGENNVILIDRGDFEVFDALEKDMQQAAAANTQQAGTPSGAQLPTGSAPMVIGGTELEYTQDIPDRKAFEKAPHPPVLPPHLLQVILNKDTPLACDPNVLPEPNHVMLNHLYALSIKEGVMVLSGTHRYRKKYVTTLLYKPI